jgi:hypothetical protein
MIPKDEQLDLGTQPRYTRQWGYNASTGSTSMFRRFADVFNSGAQEETRLRNALRMQIGKDIASNYVSIAADTHRDEMGAQMRERFGPSLKSYRPGKGMEFDNPSDITYRREGGFDDNVTKTTKTVFEYNKNYDDDATPTAGVGKPDTTNPPPKKAAAPRATKKTPAAKKTAAPKPAKKTAPAAPAVDEDGIPDAEIVEDKPTTTVTAAPTPKKRTPRKGKEGAVAEDPTANENRPDDKTL